jgi:tRNA A-37 threonylcarbamoyl transferase component Bud32
VDFDKTALPVLDEGEDTLGPVVDPNIGLVLQERYRIVRKLGEGGMGRVYEAEHILIKKRVAIKCLHSQFANNGEVIARFQREAQAASAIGNEHIVEVNDLGRFPDGSVFMALEFLDGRDLATDLEQSGALTVGRAMRIMAQVCEALAAAHEKGIVHRDLKPENIFLVRRKGNPDFVKIVDFGISKFKDSDARGMTATGAMIGTPHYMAPEQIEGRKDVDHRVDLYAMGVIMFEMLTGRMPFEASTLPKLVYEVCSVRPPSVGDFREDIPPELQAIVARLLEKEPALRFAQCEALGEALEPFLSLDVPAGYVTGTHVTTPSGIRPSGHTSNAQGRPVTVDPSAPAVLAVAPPRPRAPMAKIVGVLLVLGLVGGIAAAVSHSSGPSADTTARPPRAAVTASAPPAQTPSPPVTAVAAPVPAGVPTAPAVPPVPPTAAPAAPMAPVAPQAAEANEAARPRSRRRRGPSQPSNGAHGGSRPTPGGSEIAPIL